jgi:hypothetical protein
MPAISVPQSLVRGIHRHQRYHSAAVDRWNSLATLRTGLPRLNSTLPGQG